MSIEVKPSSERKCTNVPALVIAIVFIAITLILVTYCGIVAATQDKSIDRFGVNDSEHLSDSCGNICGQKNSGSSTDCGDPDKRGFPKLLIKGLSYDDDDDDDNDDDGEDGHPKRFKKTEECVKECPEDYEEFSNVCIKGFGEELEQLISTLKATWYFILIICFVAFIFSYIFLILFRHAAKYVIWVINIGFVVVVLALAILCAAAGSIEGAIIFFIAGLILIGFLIFFRKRIALVAKLFKEASKALIDVPSVMFEPILTFISLLLSFLIFITFYVIICFVDEEEPLALPAHIFNVISFTFITQFIIGCQNFIIAGTVVRWYFTRDKTKLEKPVKKSFSHLFKFHLGSVCLGAILITIVKIIRAIANGLRNSARDSKNIAALIIAACCICLLDIIERLLAYLVRNSYIIIAKEGTPFCDSGRRAYRLLMDNIKDVIALNHFGDIVLGVCRLLIVLIAGFVGYAVLSQKSGEHGDYITYTLIIGCVLAFLIAHCFVMVFEMSVDTIFISFCIDLEENDGETRPYYMSDSLKKIIMEMKELSGGAFVFGPKVYQGVEGGFNDGSGIPMLPPQQQHPVYPHLSYADPNNPPSYAQQPMAPYPQQPMAPYPQQPVTGYPPAPYAQQPMLPPQGYTPAPYPEKSYPEKY